MADAKNEAETHPMQGPAEHLNTDIGDGELRWAPVQRTSYHFHRASDRSKSGLPTMKVEYHLPVGSMPRAIREWICVEHTHGPGGAARNWWAARTREPFPASVDIAVDMARAGCLREPARIQVRKQPGEDFLRVVGWDLGEMRAPLDAQTLQRINAKHLHPEDDNDVPF